MTDLTQNRSFEPFDIEDPLTENFTIDDEDYEEGNESFTANYYRRRRRIFRNALVTTVVLTFAFFAFSSIRGKIFSSEDSGNSVISKIIQGSHQNSQKKEIHQHKSHEKHGLDSNHTSGHNSNHTNASKHGQNQPGRGKVRQYAKFEIWFNDHKSELSPEQQTKYEQKLAIRAEQLTEHGFHPEEIDAYALKHSHKYEDMPNIIGMPGPVLPEGFSSATENVENEEEAPASKESVEEAPTNVESVEEVPTNVESVEEAPTNVESVEEAPTNVESIEEAPTNVESVEEAPANIESVEESPALDFGGAPYLVLEEIDRDATSFTQGLTYADGILYESAGLYGQSSVRRLDPNTGEILTQISMDRQYFAEGMTYYEDDGVGKLIQITWKKKTGFIYDAATLEQIQMFTYDTKLGEGWGITYDESRDSFIVTDGSDTLHFWDRATLQETHRVQVIHPEGIQVKELNEIEYWNGLVLSNVWYQDNIYAIDPLTGNIVLDMDFSSLWPKSERGFRNDVFNGISVTDVDDELFVTGKKWPKFYRIKMNLALFN